jgi:hypothetical protein
MEREEQLKILYPALGTAAVVLLIGVLVALSDWSSPNSSKPTDKSGTVEIPVTGDDSGMSDSIPPADAPEWVAGPIGMKVWDVKEGEGKPCEPGAKVTIHYTGWTLNGAQFDSSRDKGAPATFPLGDLIKGWQEGIPGMKPGGIRRLLIPYQHAYGEAGRPPKIPPRADLLFEVKYLGSSR